MNVKDKFSLLKDVKPDTFYDILGEVVRLFDASSTMTVYLSDYTANSSFYNYAWGGGASYEARDGDEFGYIKSRTTSPKDWPGPFGKLTIQLTLFDSHAEFLRDTNVKVNDWLLLRNVQIKYGRSGGCLEGVLRGDRGSFEGKVHVQVMQPSDDPEHNDTRWKEAVRRKYAWWKRFENQKQEILKEDARLGDKRKPTVEVVKKNAKQRRKELRAAAAAKPTDPEPKVTNLLDLNEHSKRNKHKRTARAELNVFAVRCSYPDQDPVPLNIILKHCATRLNHNLNIVLPFDVCKYRANVRVVDYFPDRVADFSVGRRKTDFDLLSDYSGGEETDIEADQQAYRNGKGFAKVYEWRFALQVEDASPAAKKERMWLLVDNPSGQALLSLDASK